MREANTSVEWDGKHATHFATFLHLKRSFIGAARRRTLNGASPLRGDFVVPYSRHRRPSPPGKTPAFFGEAASPLRAG